MFYFYIIQSQKDNTFYYGSTSDLINRLKDHNYGKTKSIKYKIPYKVVYYEAYLNNTLARKRELHIKHSGKERNSLLNRLNLDK